MSFSSRSERGELCVYVFVHVLGVGVYKTNNNS